MNKFTPGTWIIEYDNADERSGGEWYIAGPAIVRFSYSATTAETEEAEANARLISAAPDLLDALDLMVTTHDEGGWPSANIVIARAAIARARGEA
jgi:hypothetical protein